MNEADEMTLEKCILRLAMASRLCDNLISKELFVLSSLIKESGLRVSDIHAVLEGNKSWVSNLCSRLAIAGLASSVKNGREVYYSLTEKGEKVADHAFNLIHSLIKAEKIPHHSGDNTFLLYRNPDYEKKDEIKKIIYPIHTHKGAILYNEVGKYLLFIGKDLKNKLLILKIPLNDIESLNESFNHYYNRRKRLRPTPLIIEFRTPMEEGLQTVYFFINYHVVRGSTNNSEWANLLNKALNQVQMKSEKPNSLESKNEIITMTEGRR
ncbi:MAG: winged helix-turn-helix transcriptional regulator [Candidatus Helarchaeota archaeon]|nr:winged helix-turn-helix transcriptional regulator [Candidatus Helarchaeota archaeon]